MWSDTSPGPERTIFSNPSRIDAVHLTWGNLSVNSSLIDSPFFVVILLKCRYKRITHDNAIHCQAHMPKYSSNDVLTAIESDKGYNLAMDKSLTLAQRLLLSRRDLRWGQDALADASGISRTYISDIERGKITNVGIEVVFSLAKALGVSVPYLLGIDEYPLSGIQDEESEETKPPTSTVGSELLNIYQQLTPQQQSTLLSIAKVLKAADEPKIVGME